MVQWERFRGNHGGLFHLFSTFSQVLIFAMLGGGSWLFAGVFLGVFFLGGGFPEHVPGKIGLEKEESDGKKTK